MTGESAYGDSYCSGAEAGSTSGTLPGSDRVDRPLLLLPEDELEWLALPAPTGVAASMELMFILEVAGMDSLRSSTGVCTGWGSSGGGGGTGVADGTIATGALIIELDSPAMLCASALA